MIDERPGLVPDRELNGSSVAAVDLDVEVTGSRYSGQRDRGSSGSRRKLVLVTVGSMVSLLGAGIGSSQLFGTVEDSRGSPTVVDSFDVDSPAGLDATVAEWEPVTGVFAARDGSARVSAANEVGPRTLTVADVSATNGTLVVTAGEMSSGWGAVFRYVGPFNYWYVQAVDDYAVFNVVRVADGVVQNVGVTDLVALRDGMALEIELKGASIEVRTGDRVVFRRTDDHGLGATRAGLLATAAGRSATWERFEFRADTSTPEPAKVVVRRPLPDGDTTRPAGADPVDVP